MKWEKRMSGCYFRGETLFTVSLWGVFFSLKHRWAQTSEGPSVLCDYPDHTPAPGLSRAGTCVVCCVVFTQTGVGWVVWRQAGRGLPELPCRAACLCSAVMSLRLCSAVMSFLHNEGPQGAAGERGEGAWGGRVGGLTDEGGDTARVQSRCRT